MTTVDDFWSPATRSRDYGEDQPFNAWIRGLGGELSSERNYYCDIDGQWYAYKAKPPFNLTLEAKSRASWPLKGQWENLGIGAQQSAAGTALPVLTYRGSRVVDYRGVFVVSIASEDGVPGEGVPCRICKLSGRSGLTADACIEFMDSAAAVCALLLQGKMPEGGALRPHPPLRWHPYEQVRWTPGTENQL